ncbi:MAG: hypothetical protein ABIF71_01210 [Planctomycetota bacterium]
MTAMAQSRAGGITPCETVVRAYIAANGGRYAVANKYVQPCVLREVARTRRQMARQFSVFEELDPLLADDPQFRRWVASFGCLIRLMIHDPNWSWKESIHRRSLAKVEITRVTVRGNRGKVYFKLHLRNGKIVRDDEPVVRLKGRWFIGEPGGI